MRITENLRCFTELHVHLDGSLPMECVRELAARQKIELTESDEELRARLSVSPDCRDLNEYLERFAFPLTLLQTQEAIEYAVQKTFESLYESGVMYAELRFAPQLHTEKGLTQSQITAAAIRGMRGCKLLGAGLILCCMRMADNKEQNLETVRVAKEFLGKGVVAVDLAGAEALYPTEDFAKEFALARELSLPFTIHAGEADCARSVRTALDFGASRIGHGVRSADDEELMKLLAERGTVLELCPTSNLQTRAVGDISEYPIRTFLDHGVRFCINTDNVTVSSTDIKREWELIERSFDLSEEEVKEILLSSVDGAFADDATKTVLREKIEQSFN